MSYFSPSAAAALVRSYPVIGVSGSRSISEPISALVSSFSQSLAVRSFRGRVFVGCASGVDACVRAAVPAAALSVFSVVRGGRVPAWAFARRSARMVESIAAARGVLVAFPSSSLPHPSVVPCKSWRSARGSGTWGSVALAVGLGSGCLLWSPSLVGASASPVLGACPLSSRFSFLGSCSSGRGSWWWCAPSFPFPVSVPVSSEQLSLF